MSKKSQPKTPGSGFISFSQVSASSFSPSTAASPPPFSSLSTTISPVYTGNDSDLSVVCKKLLKKDSTTKLKALSEIQSIFFSTPALSSPSQSSDDVVNPHGLSLLPQFLPFFVYVYLRLSLDNDRKVRESLNQTLLTLIKLNKREFQIYMKVLIGSWWMATSGMLK